MTDEPGAPAPPRPWPRRRTTAVVVLLAAVAVGAAIAWYLDAEDPAVLTGPEAVEAFLAASERNLDATYRLEGEFRRTLDDGRELVSGLLIVQRPPDRLQRSLGSTAGVVGGRVLNCSTPEGGRYECAATGDADPWEQRRAEQLDALGEYVGGEDPLYEVEATGNDCFRLVRQRTEPAAVYGREAELCFDRATGALRRLEVRRDGEATDVLEGLVITAEVSDADFDPSADDTYDPRGS